MKIENIETSRLILRGFTKEDALWAYSIWNNPEMGQYLPDEAKEDIDDEYLKMLEGLGEDEECCYLIPVFKDSMERVGTCSFMVSEDKKVYDIAYCVHKNFWCKGYATEIAQGMYWRVNSTHSPSRTWIPLMISPTANILYAAPEVASFDTDNSS